MAIETEGASARVRESLRKRVLVVEDNVDIRELLVEILASEGYEVASAGDGRQALDTALRQRPDVILLDLMMPVMSGWEFRAVQRATAALADIPVIVLSAFDSDLDVAATIPKPFVVDTVLDTIERLAA